MTLDFRTGSGEPVARLGDEVDCPIHGKTSLVTGSPDTLINGQPAVRVGDRTACGATVIEGSNTFFINGRPAAFVGCATTHGGRIIGGSPTVIIGTKNDAAMVDPDAGTQPHDRRYSLGFDFSALHEAGNHNDISYINMPIKITKPDGTYITTIRTDEYGITNRFYTKVEQDIIAWAHSGSWNVTEEYESVEDEEPSEVDNG
jgi:uncharacterized Zn-binding protein involved in type VI secretion